MHNPTRVVAAGLGVSLDDAVLLAPTSFVLEPGHVLAVTGSNGSGKTTLLRAVAGRLPASEGTVTVAGAAPDDRDPGFRGRLAALLGQPPLARNLTLREHLMLVAASWGRTTAESGDRADRLVAEFGITRLGSRFPHELSSGQTQLFALALTLARPFGVLLLDEPEQRLDAERLQRVGGILRDRADRGAAIVVASHSEALVRQIADQVLMLEEDRALPGAAHESGD